MFYIEAYDQNGKQILGNMDGQAALRVVNYKRTIRYKELSTLKTLNNRVYRYDIVKSCNGVSEKVEEVFNLTHPLNCRSC